MLELFITLTNRMNRRKDETGASAVEYGLLVALIAAIIVAGVTLIGVNVSDTFTTVGGLL